MVIEILQKIKKTRQLLYWLNSEPLLNLRTFPVLPSSRKSHRSPYGDESARNIIQTSRVSKDVTKVNNSLKRDPKRNFPSQRTASRDKKYSSTKSCGKIERTAVTEKAVSLKPRQRNSILWQHRYLHHKILHPLAKWHSNKSPQRRTTSQAVTAFFLLLNRIPTSEAHPGIAGPTNQIAAQD